MLPFLGAKQGLTALCACYFGAIIENAGHFYIKIHKDDVGGLSLIAAPPFLE